MKAMLSNGNLNLDEGTMIFFIVLIILVAIALVFLLFRSIMKERNRWSEEKGEKIVEDTEAFEEFIKRKIQLNKKAVFTLFRLDIIDYKGLVRSFGEHQYDNALDAMISNIKSVSDNIKVNKQTRETLLLYMKGKLTLKNLNQICSMILNQAQRSILVAGALKLDFDINIGVASYPESGKTLDELKQNLLLALVAAKRRGVNQFAIYDKNISIKESKEYKSYIEIKNAIENKEFMLYYQPMVNLENLEVFGAESLLRWNHKIKGVLPPSKFLNIMEHTGDINWVGFWAMEQLIKQINQWKAQYPDRKLILSMNFSPKQLMNPALPEEIRRILKRHKTDTQDIYLEIVDFAMFDMVDEVKNNLDKLRNMGFKIAIDNYGLEFSSLNRLNNISIDMIKLNRNFIQKTQENDMALEIIKMLINYSKEKNIQLIAEGIETVEALDYIKKLGIKLGQGYYFAKPGNPKELMNAVILTPWQ
ncbi:MAG: EAL domain-containing protein [Bacillota bacterium]